jgi:Domain of unknown function (DUF4157)
VFTPRVAQQRTRKPNPAHTRQTAQGPTHGLTPSENDQGSVHFLQRYLGNSSLQSLVTGSETPQESALPSVVPDVVRSPGRPLDPTLRTAMGSRFSADFSQVRVHTDTKAAESAQAIHAQAYTFGRDIVLSQGAYAPHSHRGRKLIAHELAHVIQQNRGGKPPRLDPGAAHEHDAEAVATAAVSGTGPVTVRGATGVGVARQASTQENYPRCMKKFCVASSPL